MSEFRDQLDYISRRYNVVGVDFLLSAANADEPGPRDAAILTFDDGFVDHFDYVLPELTQRNWSGAFYPPAAAILERRLLDVHRIHFILASVGNSMKVANAMDEMLLERLGAEEVADLRSKWAAPNELDDVETVYVKRVLQLGLPRHIRSAVCGALFARFVTGDERSFAEELYLTLEQLKLMSGLGMHVGGHGYSHEWLGSMRPDEQQLELEKSIEMLDCIGVDRASGWSMAYPYGDRNDATRSSLANLGCGLAFTTEARVVDTRLDEVLDVPRIDTVHLEPARFESPT